MKKNFTKIALFVALQAIGFTTQVSSMQVPDKDKNKDKKDVILTLDRKQIQGLSGVGVYTVEQAVSPESKIASLGLARGGLQLVARQEFPDKRLVYSVPLKRLTAYLSIEYQPGKCAYPVHHPVDIYGNSLLHTILKVLLDLEYKIRMLGQDANKEYAQALTQAQTATRESLNHLLALPAVRTPHAQEAHFFGGCSVINGQNKAGITPAHLCVAWLNPDALGTLAAVGFDDHKGAVTQRANMEIDNGVYKNLLHFLVVFLHDGKEYQRLFGCPMAAMTDAGTQLIKNMIRTLIVDFQLPVLKVVRDTFEHPDYAAAQDKDGRERDNKEVALLRALPDYILEALIIPLTPKIAEALRELLPVKQLYKPIAEYAANDDIRELFKKAQ